VVQALIDEEPISPTAPTANPPNELVAVAVPIVRQSVRLIPKTVDHPELVSRKELPVGWQGPSLGERFVRYWNEVGASFVRDWKELYGEYGPVRAARRKRR
jgi:hypothetical protein